MLLLIVFWLYVSSDDGFPDAVGEQQPETDGSRPGTISFPPRTLRQIRHQSHHLKETPSQPKAATRHQQQAANNPKRKQQHDRS